MPSDFLERIVQHKKELLQKKKAFYASLAKKFSSESLTRYQLFKRVISAPLLVGCGINLIAEIKKASPSRGVICKDFDPVFLSKIYVHNHASALSILTEDKFFMGSPSDIKKVSDQLDIPILTKDFILDEGQIYEAFVCGASAVLLIVAILSPVRLKELMTAAAGLDLDCLVEVHDETELDVALEAGAEIIGINNRNLKTFEVDLSTAERLIKKISEDKVIVIESGIQTLQEVQRFKSLGAHAVLIGETFLKAPDVGEKVREVMGY